MVLKVSKRGEIPPFIVMDVMRQANAMEALGKNVLHMEVGQPSTGAPSGVIKAVNNFIVTETLGYTEAFGIADLRKRIARHYMEWYEQPVDASNIVISTGSSGAFVLSFLAAFDPGDRVALTFPGYPAYRNILRALDIEVVDISVGQETNFQLTTGLVDEVQSASGSPVDGLVIASPSNPTGTMLDPAQLEELARYCENQGIRLVSDEIYHGITYGTQAQTALSYSNQAIVINSFSKYFSMTGWRLGWMVLPSELLRAVECLGQNLFISPPSISQMAGVEAFNCHEELKANLRRYRKNRGILLDALPKAGLNEIAASQGAFYIYANVGHLTSDSVDFCRRMLGEICVAATPGTDFDTVKGGRYVRFSFAGDTSSIREAAVRLKNWLS